MRSSSCSGGGSFHPEKGDDNCTINGSKPAFWNTLSDEGFSRQAGQLTSPHNEEAYVDHDTTSVPEAKQRKSGKAARSNGNSSRRSRAAHMEASLNVTEIVDVNDLPEELGSCPEKYNIADTSVSGKRSEKRNGKLSKNKCDIFSIKSGLSSFRSSAGGNSVLGIHGSKRDIRDFAKHVDEVSLNELLDGSYKCPDSIKVKEQSTEGLNGSILLSVREACSVTSKSLLKPQQTHLLVTSFRSGPTGHHANILQFPLFEPKDVLDNLTLLPHKDLDLMLLDIMKPTSTSKVHSGGSLPTFPWSHVSGGHFKVNPDAVKSSSSKSTCQGRWIKMGKLIMSLGDATTYLADFQSLTYNPSLVPLGSQQPRPTENDKSLLVSTFGQKSEGSYLQLKHCATLQPYFISKVNTGLPAGKRNLPRNL
ncbi:hypothetical protein HanPI659440_Chr06g0221681 [Helianthus annuus]|nr:hypothetical protein HanPI659440_Chr06g0221681 [Helianthus annuus]